MKNEEVRMMVSQGDNNNPPLADTNILHFAFCIFSSSPEGL
jgi:hypothetical protein